MADKYFTLQIHWGDSGAPTITELKDLTPGDLELNTWKKLVRQNLYTTGFNLETAPGTTKFVSPFLVHSAYLIQQDKKYSID